MFYKTHYSAYIILFCNIARNNFEIKVLLQNSLAIFIRNLKHNNIEIIISVVFENTEDFQ